MTDRITVTLGHRLRAARFRYHPVPQRPYFLRTSEGPVPDTIRLDFHPYGMPMPNRQGKRKETYYLWWEDGKLLPLIGHWPPVRWIKSVKKPFSIIVDLEGRPA